MTEPKLTPLQVVEAKRAARKASLEAQRDEQRAIDLEAVYNLETEHGDNGVAVLNVPYTPGLPTLCAARKPTAPEMKRYRDRCRPRKDGAQIDGVPPAEELAACCRVYPSDVVYADMLADRAGIHVQLGVEALKLAAGSAEAEGKG